VSSLHSLIHREDGQALPEFALVVPLLVVILFAVIAFGKAFNYWNDATHISAEGARYAAVNNKPFPANAASLQAQLHAQADTDELRNGRASGDVTSPSQVLGLAMANTDVESTSVMRLETAPTNYVAGCA
jgi:Flp pilus assembly protein TadG